MIAAWLKRRRINNLLVHLAKANANIAVEERIWARTRTLYPVAQAINAEFKASVLEKLRQLGHEVK